MSASQILALSAAGSLFLSYLLTAWLIRHPLFARLLDRPNERSSHTIPTRRGGGIAFFCVTTLALLALFLAGTMPARLLLPIGLGGTAIALVGLRDDVRPVPVRVRLLIHFGAALCAVLALGWDHPIRLGALPAALGVTGAVLKTLAIVWVLNLFNFMDGIDGIAASEAIFVLLAAALLGTISGDLPGGELQVCVVLSAACLGFLRWNWSPAAIFMGDVGSGYLGYVIAVLTLDSAQQGALNVSDWIVLGGVFLVDATITLVRRVARRESVHQPHRSHAYQWLTRRWNSHAKVSALVWAINVLWLLPWAAAIVRFPAYSVAICCGSLAPLVAGALWAKAGKSE